MAKSLYSVHPSIAYTRKIIENLKARTGRSIDEWIAFVKKSGPKTEAERRAWLKEVHKLGTNYASWSTVQWGGGSDIPVPGDYDADGKTDLGIFRPGTAYWFVMKSSTNYTAWSTIQWGAGTDTPVPGDYDRDGKTDVAVFRPSAGTWFILKSSANNSQWMTFAWGTAGDTPVP